MGKLKDDSKLYNVLSEIYDSKKDGEHDLELYNECVDKALDYGRREIRYVIFSLKSLYGEVNTGIESADILTKVTKSLAGDSFKAFFIISVLETALDEK